MFQLNLPAALVILSCSVFPWILYFNGIPKSSILIGFSIINHPFWGAPIFENTHFFSLKNQAKPGTVDDHVNSFFKRKVVSQPPLFRGELLVWGRVASRTQPTYQSMLILNSQSIHPSCAKGTERLPLLDRPKGSQNPTGGWTCQLPSYYDI